MIHKLICFLLIVLLGCSEAKDNDLARIKLKELNDQPIDVSQYKGKTIFINFWATWCKPCIQEMPTIERAQDKLKDEDVIFLLASNDERDQLEKFINRHSFNFHYVQLENLEELKIQALPTTFIFNREGKLKFSETGFRTWDDASSIELINKILNDDEK